MARFMRTSLPSAADSPCNDQIESAGHRRKGHIAVDGRTLDASTGLRRDHNSSADRRRGRTHALGSRVESTTTERIAALPMGRWPKGGELRGFTLVHPPFLI